MLKYLGFNEVYNYSFVSAKDLENFAISKKAVYIPPFDDLLVIAGQGTIGKEIYEDFSGKLDYILVPIGGGGLISGIAAYLKEKNSKIFRRK